MIKMQMCVYFRMVVIIEMKRFSVPTFYSFNLVVP